MLKKRIIPILLCYKGNLVKTKNFENIRNIGNPNQIFNVFKDRNLDELVIIDLAASKEKLKFDTSILDNFSYKCNMPLIVGGGLNNTNDVELVLNKGADKIIIGSSALNNPKIINDIAKKFGSQSIMLSIDVKLESGKYFIYSHSAKKKHTINIIEWIKKVQDLGAGEILLNSIDNEGTMKGYDLQMLKKIHPFLKVPLVFNGGAGKIEDFITVLENKKIMAVAASSVFLFSEITPNMIKKKALKNNINVRI